MAGNKGKGKVEEVAPILDETLPSPVATFDIGDIENLVENYKTCVEAIRGAMGTTDVKFKFIDGQDTITVPVTPGEDNTRSGAYVIEIRYGEKSLSLVATKYQAWFRGIVTNNRRRYEIDKMPTKMMKGSTSLHTDGQYTDLCPDGVATLKLGYQQLLRAFHAFTTHGEAGNQHVHPVKKAELAVLIVMFFEGPRFPDVCQLVEDLLSSSGLNRLVGKTNGKLINNWCSTSKDFYHANWNDRSIIISHASSQIVKDVKKDFRILCRTEWDKLMAKLSEATASTKSRASSSKSNK